MVEQQSQVSEYLIDDVLKLKACGKGIQLILELPVMGLLHKTGKDIQTFKLSVKQAKEITGILSMLYPESVYRHWDEQK